MPRMYSECYGFLQQHVSSLRAVAVIRRVVQMHVVGGRSSFCFCFDKVYDFWKATLACEERLDHLIRPSPPQRACLHGSCRKLRRQQMDDK